MVVEPGEARSEGDAGDVVLDEAVDVDDGGAAAELRAGDQHEHEGDDGVDGLEHRAVAVLLRRHVIGGKDLGLRDRSEMLTTPNFEKTNERK